MTNNKQQTAVEWLVEQFKEYDFADVKDTENYIIKMQSFVLTEKLDKAKEMEEKQKGYTLEQMMDCWNAALKFEPHGPNFNDYIMSLKLKENRDEQLDFLTEQAQELNLGYNKTTEE